MFYANALLYCDKNNYKITITIVTYRLKMNSFF